MIHVPYITIEDLNTVLNAAVADYTISKKTAAHLQDLAIEYTRELIRKSEATKALNAERQKMLNKLFACVATVKSRAGNRKIEADLKHRQDVAALKRNYEINKHEIKNAYADKANECVSMLQRLSIDYKRTDETAERIKIMEKEQRLQEKRRTLESMRNDELHQADLDFADELRHLDTRLARDLAHAQCDMSESDYRRLHLIQRITYSTPDTMPGIDEELSRWMADLQSVAADEAQKGGAA